MFHKEITLKSESLLKSSVRKRWSATVCELYPSCSSMFEGKISVKQAQYGFKRHLYFIDDEPAFFEHDEILFPTVYTLWRFPDLLDQFFCDEGVLVPLQNGADLMAPGLLSFRPCACNESRSTSWLPIGNPLIDQLIRTNLPKGSACSVVLKGNGAPVAVGYTARSTREMYEAAMAGKAIIILHIYRDKLWLTGSRKRLPQIPEPPLSSDELVPSDNGRLETTKNRESDSATLAANELSELNLGDGDKEEETSQKECFSALDDLTTNIADPASSTPSVEGAEAGPSSQEEDTEPCEPQLSAEDILDYCFLCALRRIKSSQLPILTNNFYQQHLLPACPPQFSIDLKQTRWKKLSVFLKDYADRDLIQIKALSKGNDFITAVNTSHDLLETFRPRPEFAPPPVAAASGEGDQRLAKPRVQEIYFVTAAVLPLFSSAGFRKSDSVTGQEARQIVGEYIKSKGLQDGQNKRFVQLDDLLLRVLSVGPDRTQNRIAHDQVYSKLFSRMTPGIVIQQVSGEKQVLKGKFEPIVMSLVQKASNKKATQIRNLTTFGIEMDEFAKAVKLKAQCSATVDVDKLQRPIVQVQGNQIHIAAAILEENYNIPKKWIHGLELAPKGYKKK